MASRQTPGPKKDPKKTDIDLSDLDNTPSPAKPANIEDLGDLNDIHLPPSMTISALVEAAVGDDKSKSPPTDLSDHDDDDDALGLGKPLVGSGPPSGILRPSAMPDDDALSLDLLPSTPGNEASLSFVARSDIRGDDSEFRDVIATDSIKPPGKTPAWFTTPSTKVKSVTGPKSGKIQTGEQPSGSTLHKSTDGLPDKSDIFSAPATGVSSAAAKGDSNLLSAMVGRVDSSNILGSIDASSLQGRSDILTGDSRILADSKPGMNSSASDILSNSRMANSSDILAGSSLFDDPEKRTDELKESKSVASKDQFVPLFNESPGSSIILNSRSEESDDLAGLINFDIPRKPKQSNSSGTEVLAPAEESDDERTSFMPTPEDEDDAMAAEFLGAGGGRSGVNLLGNFEHQETMSEGEEEESNEDVFNARTIMDMDIGATSGLNLLTPNSEKYSEAAPAPGTKSDSIFSGPPSGKIDAKSNGSEVITRSDVNSPASIFGPSTGQSGPSSEIFPSGKTKDVPTGHVNFDIPQKNVDNTDRLQASSLIDWSKGATDSDQMSLRSQTTDQMSQPDEMRISAEDTARTEQKFELEESDSVFDVHLPEDASTESQLLKAEQYARAAAAGTAVAESGILAGRSGKLPKVEPVSSRTKFVPPPPPPKRNRVGWLGGTAAGLLTGVGLSSAAYFGGLVPNGPAVNQINTSTAEISQLRADYESRLSRATADQNTAVENAKSETLKEARKVEQELAAKLTVAQNTVKAANEARDLAVRNLDAARKDATSANTRFDEARTELLAATKARDEAIENLKPLQAKLQNAEAAAKKAESSLANATTQVEMANTALTKAVKELQATNLIDPKLDPAKAIAALPDAIKKAAVAGQTPDSKRLQELTGQLLTAKKDAETARNEATISKTNADKALAKAQQDVAAATEKLQAELKTVKAATGEEVKKEVAKATAASQAKIDALAAELRREQDERRADAKQFETKVAAMTEEFRQQITAARAGVLVAQTDTERAAAEKAARLFGIGTDAYFEGRFADAIQALTDATKANPSDARVWYYLGLSQFSSGDRNAAAVSYQTAARWEARSSTAARQVGSSLERVQGPARTFLETFRP